MAISKRDIGKKMPNTPLLASIVSMGKVISAGQQRVFENRRVSLTRKFSSKLDVNGKIHLFAVSGKQVFITVSTGVLELNILFISY